MRHFKPVLNRKGLLVAAVALGSGTAFAETAGRVNFVTGGVTVTPASGGSRVLQRGDLINGGDRISTNTGRVQIRFTDGGFVSLQPGTVFRVDEYLYANRKPEETSVFFNLVQGGMRTVTGLIGKVNKQSYKVRTPVATIGIRGTEYLAQMNEDGLRVSVGAGFVVTENNAGSVVAGPGQNLHVPGPDSQPELSEEAPLLQAAGVEGDAQQVAEENSQDNTARRDVRAGDLEPTYVTTATAYRQIVTPPGNLISSVSTGNVTTFDSEGLLSVTSPVSHPGGAFSAPIMAVTEGGGTVTVDDALFKRGSLKVVNNHSEGGIRWGEFTDGESEVNSLFSYQGSIGVLALGADEFLPYLTGTPLTSGYTTGTATYALQGGTARSGSGVEGTLDKFDLTYNFGSNLVDVVLKATLGSTTYTASGDGLSTYPYPNGVFQLGGLSTSSTDPIICSAGCTTDINAFFSGVQNAQIGAGYAITSSTTHVSGVAALGRTGYTAPPVTPPGTPYQIASVTHDAATGESLVNVVTGAFATLDNEGGLLTVQGASGSTLFDKGSWGISNPGHHTQGDSEMHWGEFMDGTSAVDQNIFLSGPAVLAGNAFVPWIVGTPLTSGYTSGSATYSLAGGTARGYGTGTLHTFNLTYNFGTHLANVLLEATVYINDTTQSTYTASGHNIATNLDSQGTFMLPNLETYSIDTGDVCYNSGCLTNIKAFFSGSHNTQVGASYAILNPSGNEIAAGVAALGQTGYDPSGGTNAVAFVYGDGINGFSGGFSADYATGDTLALTMDNDGALLSAIGTAPYAILDRSNASTAVAGSVGADGSLNWGRWYTGTSAVVGLGEGSLPLEGGSAPKDLHYIAGNITNPDVFGTYNSTYNGTATATYSYAGGTTATGSDGRTGTLDGTLQVAFTAIPTLSADLALTMNDATTTTYAFGGSGIAITDSRFADNGLACTGGVNGCAAGITGFFSGSQAEQVGLGYSVYDIGLNHSASGAAAFNRSSILTD